MIQGTLLDSVRFRDYQSRIIEQGAALLREGHNPLVEMATGTGKTVTVAGICAIIPGRVLWMAHRVELVRQAKVALSYVCREPVGLEMPGHKSAGERLVVASKDSLRPARLHRMADTGKFDLIGIDEAHHSAAKSYQVAPRYWPGARVLGMTATPFRGDKRGLKLFTAATDPYRLPQAMSDGWLVPFKAKRVKIKSIDLEGIDVVAGDLSQSQLAALTRSETNLSAVCEAIKANAGDRPTIVYCISVDVAERMAELLGPTARCVSQHTGDSERSKTFAHFGTSYLQFLVNVGVATEGTDLPPAACIAMYRPTLSVSLFQQMLGRGGRTLPGLTGYTSDDRKAWIAASGKPDCLILDFVGNAGKHAVVTVAAAFTDDEDAQEEIAKRLDAGEELLASEATLEEESKQRRKRDEDKEQARMRVRISSEAQEISLIGLGGEQWAEVSDLTGAITPRQVETLRRYGISGNFSTRADARSAIVAYRKAAGLATPKQVDFVKKHYPKEDLESLTKARARTLLLGKLKRWGQI